MKLLHFRLAVFSKVIFGMLHKEKKFFAQKNLKRNLYIYIYI